MNSRFFERARLLGTLIGSAILLASGTSRALSCASSFPPTPEDGATGVPTNTLLWSFNGGNEPASIRLLGPGGQVALEERSLALRGGGRRSVLRPVEELAPLSEYTVEITWLDREGQPSRRPGGALDGRETHFTTGAGPAQGAPALPRVVSSEPYVGYGWFGGDQRGIQLSFDEHPGILIGDAGGAAGSVEELEDLLVPLPLPSDADPADRIAALEARVAELEAQLAGSTLPEAHEVTWVTLQNWLAVGPADCLFWPGGTRVDGRFAVLDLAGNFSGWLEGVDLSLPSDDDVRAFLAANPQREPDMPVHTGSSSSEAGCQLGVPGARATPMSAGLLLLSAAATAIARRRRGSN